MNLAVLRSSHVHNFETWALESSEGVKFSILLLLLITTIQIWEVNNYVVVVQDAEDESWHLANIRKGGAHRFVPNQNQMHGTVVIGAQCGNCRVALHEAYHIASDKAKDKEGKVMMVKQGARGESGSSVSP